MKNVAGSLVLIGILVSGFPVHAATLDRQGTANPPDYYTCTQVKLSPQQGATGASGGGDFRIGLDGLCAVHPGEGLAGWTAVAWKQVYLQGDYNYATQKGSELVRLNGQTIFSVSFTCTKNPWAYGPTNFGEQICSVTNGPTNETGALVNAPYPISPKYLDGSLILAIREAENWQSPEEMLAGWNPLEQPGGASAFTIKKPEQYEMIDQTSQYYAFEFQPKQETAELVWNEVQIERLEEVPDVVGDIAMPKTYSHWWQPFWSGQFPATVTAFPIGITQGLFAGTTGVFRVRIIGTTSSVPKKEYIGGWTPWRTFCIGDPSASCSTMGLASAGQATEALKAMQYVNLLNLAASTDSQTMQQKKNQLAMQMHDKVLTKMMDHGPEASADNTATAGSRIKDTKSTGAILPTSPLPRQQQLPLSLLSFNEIGKHLTVKLKNDTTSPLDHVPLAIVHPVTGKQLWSADVSLSPGITVINIKQDDLAQGFMDRVTRTYQLTANGAVLGTTVITAPPATRLTTPQTGQLKPGASPNQAAEVSRSPQELKSAPSPLTALAAKPKLEIAVKLQSTSLKENDQATFLVTVKNAGATALGATDTYTLRCSPDCPFRANSGRLPARLQPGTSENFRLVSNSLKAGSYDLQVTTPYGSSQHVPFSVSPESLIRQAPDRRTERVRTQ